MVEWLCQRVRELGTEKIRNFLASPAPRSKALVEEVRQKHVQSEREKLRAKRRCKIVVEWYRSVQVGTGHINFNPVPL